MRILIPCGIRALMLAGLLALPAPSGAETNPIGPAPATNTTRVVCVGDSITYGSGLDDPEQQSYPARLAKILGPKWDIQNFGQPGATCLAKSDHPLCQTGAIPMAMATDPQIVLILLGTNDSKAHNWTRPENFIPDYQDLLTSFLNLHTHPKVWLCTPLPVFTTTSGFSDDRIRTEVIPKVRAIAAKAGISVIDLYEPFRTRGDLLPDGIHPNAEGATLIANIIARVIQADHDVAP
ncbi:MAG: sialate O-acetylesterase [Lentisphaerae bacterium]|nr:sialate O-acetylesterase [Lentisphaerota bacterium]